MQLNEVLIKPLVTEKSTVLKEKGVYSFVIAPKANKILVKQAIKSLFKVDVEDCNIIVQKGKRVSLRTRRGFGQKSGQKKAIVRLKDGQKIGELDV